jgi:hypothetical protein
MSRTVVVELADNHQLARDLVAGGVFVPDVLALGDDCALVLRNGDAKLELRATCVFVAAKGSGLQLVDCDADMKQRIVALASGMTGISVSAPARADDDADSPPADDEAESPPADAEETPLTEALDPEEAARLDVNDDDRRLALNVNERLRGLTLVQQLKVAQKGELTDRVVLERLYGKAVWEALLRNPRITGPEVARIARMGALPRPLLELIVGNGGWLAIPEVRRALLCNPRLATDQALRVLRLLPKHELKLAGTQTAYPFAVRDAAKRMLKDSAGG